MPCQSFTLYRVNMTCPQELSTYCTFLLKLMGVSPWPVLPLSPKFILPIPSGPKHIEKEFAERPLLAKMLGTDRLSIPSPNKPLGAAPSKNEPV